MGYDVRCLMIEKMLEIRVVEYFLVDFVSKMMFDLI